MDIANVNNVFVKGKSDNLDKEVVINESNLDNKTEITKEQVEVILKDRKPTTSSKDDALFLASNYFPEKNPRGLSYQQWIHGVNRLLEFEANSANKYIPSPEQYRCIISLAKHTLVDATAGSGKSTTMVLKGAAEEVLLGYDGTKMLAITYTADAAVSMKEKYAKFCKNYRFNGKMRFSTIHALASRYVAYTMPYSEVLSDPIKGVTKVIKAETSSGDDDDDDFTFFEDEDDDDITAEDTVITITSRDLIMKALEVLNLKNKYFKHLNNIDRWISILVERDIQSQDELKELQEFIENPDVRYEDLASIHKLTREYRQSYDVIDFSDMLVNFHEGLMKLETLEGLPTHIKELLELEVLFIDEFQDISPKQWNIVLELLRLNPNCRLFCVGDADQAIYSFRGANPKFLVEFEETIMGKGRPLHEIDIMYFTINRRCASQIVDLSTKFIVKNKFRYDKEMHSANHIDGQIQLIEDESTLISKGLVLSSIEETLRERPTKLPEIAVLYREHNQALPLIIELIKKRIPVNVSSGRLPMDTRTMDDVLGIIQMLYDSTNPFLVETYLYKFFKSIKKADAKKIATKMRQTGKRFSDFLDTSKTNIAKELKEARLLWSLLDKDKMANVTNLLLSKYHETNSFMGPHVETEIEMVRAYLLTEPDFTFKEFARYHEQTKKWIKENTKAFDGVTFKTTHSAKGLEYEEVFILPFGDNVTPKESILKGMPLERVKEQYIEEERRLLFVALTRAKKKLTIFVTNKNHMFPREVSTALETITNNTTTTFLEEKSVIEW